MELPRQEAKMPIQLNSTYGGLQHGHGHMIHHHHHNNHPPPPPPPPPPPLSHNHIISSPAHPQIPSNGAPAPITSTLYDHDDDDDDDNHDVRFKKLVKYKECLKNHAASMGGNATDGCGEFMPSGEEGTLEALTCSACNCHRNFHRKEIEGELLSDNNNNYYYNIINNNVSNNPRTGRKVFLGHHHMGYLGQDNNIATGYHHQISSRARHHHVPQRHHQMIMSYNYMGGGDGGGSLPSESDEMEGNGGGDSGVVVRQPQMVKKRFRTKFTAEQKEKMLRFAEKGEWKIQKQEEAVVQQFCQEVGVKRRVLKVWMHNNKHNLAKKNLHHNSENQV